MEFRDRTLNLDCGSRADKRSQPEKIRESIYSLWFSVQKRIQQQIDPSASPSDYAERVEKLVTARLKHDSEIEAVDEAVRDAFRDIAQNDQRSRLRQRIRFDFSRSLQLELIRDPKSDGYAATLEDNSHNEWQIEEIRRRVDPETMTILEQLYGFHSEQWTIDNLAKKMGIRKNTLEQRLSRTFAKLRGEFRG